MFLFYSFMCFRTKCVNKCLHENEFFQASSCIFCRPDVGIYVGTNVGTDVGIHM